MRMISFLAVAVAMVAIASAAPAKACDVGCVQQFVAAPVVQQFVQPVYAAPALTLGDVYQSMAASSIRNGIPVQSWLTRELQKPAAVLSLPIQTYAQPVSVQKVVVPRKIVQRVQVVQPVVQVQRVKTRVRAVRAKVVVTPLVAY